MFNRIKILDHFSLSSESQNANVTNDTSIHKAHSDQTNELVIDVEGYAILFNDKRIVLPKKEFELLHLLGSKPDKVFRREEILEKVWGSSFKPKDSRSLDVHIRMLRKKLDETFITTIRGVGYRLNK